MDHKSENYIRPFDLEMVTLVAALSALIKLIKSCTLMQAIKDFVVFDKGENLSTKGETLYCILYLT